MTREEEIGLLYATHARSARALAYLLTGERELAEDLVQDCFLRLCSRLRPVGQDELPAYLRRMVINAARSHFRRMGVRRRHAAVEAEVLGSEGDVSPDRAARWADREGLRRALLALPPRQRTAVVLRHWLELTEEETAREMGCSVGTVKSLASHGRAGLRERVSAMDTLEHALRPQDDSLEGEWSR